jgi:hypothetical protein
MLFAIAILQLLNSSLASAKNLGSVVFYESESAYFYEQKITGSNTTVFYQPKLEAAWKQVASLDQGKLWQVNVNFRSDVDLNEVKTAVPLWKEKIFVRASIEAVSDCRFTPDVPGRFKAKLKLSTAGKTFSGLHLCQFEVLTKPGDTDILTNLREMTRTGRLFVSGLEELTFSALEPELPVSVDAVHQYLLPFSARLSGLDQATAQFALLLAVGGLKGEVLLSLVEKVETTLLLVLEQKIFVKNGNKFDLHSNVDEELIYLGYRILSKTIRL